MTAPHVHVIQTRSPSTPPSSSPQRRCSWKKAWAKGSGTPAILLDARLLALTDDDVSQGVIRSDTHMTDHPIWSVSAARKYPFRQSRCRGRLAERGRISRRYITCLLHPRTLAKGKPAVRRGRKAATGWVLEPDSRVAEVGATLLNVESSSGGNEIAASPSRL